MIIGYRFPLTIFGIAALLLSFSSFLPANQDDSLDTAKAFISALSKRDANSALLLLSDGAILEMPFPLAGGENKYGTRRMWGEPLRQYVTGITERNSQIAFNNTVWRKADDGVVILECDGDMVRSKDGKRYQNQYIVLFEVSDGKITLWREYFNPVVAARTFEIPLESLPY
jgi:ketosteroid isomerase-like protein